MAIKAFNINNKKPTSLSQYSDGKIIIKKIDIIEGDINDLFSPIRVSTNLPTGQGHEYYIHPIEFYSNKTKAKGTDLEMNIVIHYCKYTQLIISQMSGKNLVFRINYSTVEGEPLRIIVNQDMEGYTFSLTPSSKEIIISKFPNARPVRSIYIGYDTKQNFEMMYGKVERHIFPALTDLTKEQLNQIGEIQLIDFRTSNIIKQF